MGSPPGSFRATILTNRRVPLDPEPDTSEHNDVEQAYDPRTHCIPAQRFHGSILNLDQCCASAKQSDRSLSCSSKVCLDVVSRWFNIRIYFAVWLFNHLFRWNGFEDLNKNISVIIRVNRKRSTRFKFEAILAYTFHIHIGYLITF